MNTQKKGSFAKGMMTGAVMGATTAMIVEPMLFNKKKSKHSMHTFQSMGHMVDTVMNTLR